MDIDPSKYPLPKAYKDKFGEPAGLPLDFLEPPFIHEDMKTGLKKLDQEAKYICKETPYCAYSNPIFEETLILGNRTI